MGSRQTKNDQVFRKPLKLVILGFISLSVFIIACKKGEDPFLPSISQSNQIPLINAVYTFEIAPLNDSLLNDYKNLKLVYDKYLIDTSAQNHISLKEAWKSTVLHYEKASLFNITPVRRKLYFAEMYTFPFSSTDNISLLYKNKTTVDLSNVSYNKKGLALIEKLVFEEDSLHLYEGVFKSCTDDLILTQSELITFWDQELKTAFNAGEVISINNGYGELINSFIAMIEVSNKEEFNIPFGYYNTQKAPLKAFTSGFSKEIYEEKFNYLNYIMSEYFYKMFRSEGQNTLACNFENAFKALDLSMESISGESFENLHEQAPTSTLDEMKLASFNLLKVFKLQLVPNYSLLLAISAADGD